VSLPSEILDETPVLFEDVRVEEVDPEAHADFVIARVLERGTLGSVRALVHRYGVERIRSFFSDHGGADQVTGRTLSPWASFLGLRADECTSRSSRWTSARFWIA
jgi:hypothetical protein